MQQPVLVRVVGWSSFFLAFVAFAGQWVVDSPNGNVEVVVRTTPSAPDGTVGLEFQVLRKAAQGQTVRMLGPGALGFVFDRAPQADRIQRVQAGRLREITHLYTLLHGKRRRCRNRGRELTLHCQSVGGIQWDLVVRAYNDGVVFQYRFLEPKGWIGEVLKEQTVFRFPSKARLWMAPAAKITKYSPAYEEYYRNGIPPTAESPYGLGWSFPVLFEVPGGWGLVTESGYFPQAYGSRLASVPRDGGYRVELPSPEEGNGYGRARPQVRFPWTTPWRVVIVGDRPGAIVESTLVTDVAPPCRLKQTDWIRPGRVAWSWWSDPKSPLDAEKQKRFIDLAAEMGWEYVLVDANWTRMERGNLFEVLEYAKQKGIGGWLWYNSGGPHNVVTEKPCGMMFFRSVRRFEMDWLKKIGVCGVKVDFFQSDKQEIFRLYQEILEDAARARLMVNFHGCTLPRGWERAYPNLMSMEAVRGEECYIYDSEYPDRAPVQNTILPFTRNAVGPMDYTPCGFTDRTYRRKTTWAHELALTVLFESGLLHFCDAPRGYHQLPEFARAFLQEVPVVWDEVRVLDGEPGRFVILARRAGSKWYVAGVNGTSQPQRWQVNLSSLLSGRKATMRWIQDGRSRTELEKRSVEVDPDHSVLSISVLPRGGFVGVLSP